MSSARGGYWSAYQASHLLHDSRKEFVLSKAHELLLEVADKLGDLDQQKRYLEEVPFHKAVVLAWRHE